LGPPTCTFAVAGETPTMTGAGTRVTVASADTSALATDVARTVTTAGTGRTTGGV